MTFCMFDDGFLVTLAMLLTILSGSMTSGYLGTLSVVWAKRTKECAVARPSPKSIVFTCMEMLSLQLEQWESNTRSSCAMTSEQVDDLACMERLSFQLEQWNSNQIHPESPIMSQCTCRCIFSIYMSSREAPCHERSEHAQSIMLWSTTHCRDGYGLWMTGTCAMQTMSLLYIMRMNAWVPYPLLYVRMSLCMFSRQNLQDMLTLLLAERCYNQDAMTRQETMGREGLACHIVAGWLWPLPLMPTCQSLFWWPLSLAKVGALSMRSSSSRARTLSWLSSADSSSACMGCGTAEEEDEASACVGGLVFGGLLRSISCKAICGNDLLKARVLGTDGAAVGAHEWGTPSLEDPGCPGRRRGSNAATSKFGFVFLSGLTTPVKGHSDAAVVKKPRNFSPRILFLTKVVDHFESDAGAWTAWPDLHNAKRSLHSAVSRSLPERGYAMTLALTFAGEGIRMYTFLDPKITMTHRLRSAAMSSSYACELKATLIMRMKVSWSMTVSLVLAGSKKMSVSSALLYVLVQRSRGWCLQKDEVV